MASKSSSSSSSAISSSSTSTSLNKSVNGSLQASNRSRASVVKRSVTPNSRALHSNISAAEADAKPKHRSVTPVSRNHGDGEPPVVVAKLAPAGSKRSLAPFSRSDSLVAHDPEPGRVRVAVRLRPRNAEDLASDSDYVDCVELQPELKKLKLRKNNWSSESYRFDEVLTETASQKRVYQAVAKPVVESVLSGYNGTVMAYGQTGTGKTHTVGNLGKNDASDRGIMVRAVEDIIANTSPGYDTVEFSYMQLYMESVQDLLSPEKVNIPIVEDPKTGEVSLPGAEVVHIQDLDQFMDLLQRGDANRHAANTKMNTNSSRSHAILMVYVKRSVDGKPNTENGGFGLSTIRKSKLLIVDLAGSERIDKSGSEGHLLEEAKFINLSLTSLGKCINALAENSPHIPTRESKLTRLLRDSFGGSARTSLIITIGPSSRHHAETTSTIMFGQRAMKIVNMVKLKEEFDYESFSRKLERQVDNLTKEVDRQQKLRENQVNEMQKKLKECQQSYNEAEKDLIARSEILEKENSRLKAELEIVRNDLNAQKDCNKVLGDKVVRLEMRLEHFKGEEEVKSNQWRTQLEEMRQMGKAEIFELNKRLEKKDLSHEVTMKELESLRAKYMNLSLEKDKLAGEVENLRDKLMIEEKQKVTIESELLKFKKPAQESNADVEEKKLYVKQLTNRGSSSFRSTMGLPRSISGQRMNLAQLCEEVGLEKILSMLSSDDIDHQMYAVKVVANLAAEDVNQENIVNDGGLDALLMILRTSQNTTILRVASGAIANLAMNEINQGLIMSKGGAQLLATTASKTDDPQTLRMVAGAIANLCGNAKLHMILKDNGCINALLGMSKSNNVDVAAQVSRGLANFAKCETREVIQGHRKGPSLLTDAGALTWLIENSKDSTSDPSQRHIELALCHLAQNDDNTHDIISCGGLKKVIRISQKSAREDIRNLATKTLKSNPTFQAQLRVDESTNT